MTPFTGEIPHKVVIAHENITDRKIAENRYKDSEQRLRLVLDISPNCIFIEDSDGRFILVNQAVADLYGTTIPAMIGKTQKEISPFGFYASGGAHGNAASGSDGDEKKEISFTTADGNIRWFKNVQVPISFPNFPNCLLSFCIDITDQRLAQEALRNSELRLKTILDAQTSMIVLVDPRMRVLWPNREACRVAGMSRQEIIGRPCHALWKDQKAACDDCPVVDAFQNGKKYSIHKKTPDGRVWRIHGFPVRDDAGAIVSAVEVSEDITQRVALEDQLRQAQKMESLGTLAGGIAHDFNNILSAIMGYTELAMEGVDPSAKAHGYIKEVHRAGVRATDLARQILTFSRRTNTDLLPLNIGIIVKEVLKLLRSTLPSSITIKQQIDKKLDPILADPTQIHQIVMNLCTNASHAMEPYGGILEVKLTQSDFTEGMVSTMPNLAPGSYLRLDISDTGCGMPPEIMASIFDPYFTTKDLGEGTGLGLSVVHGIVKDYGGDISVRSTVGEGSTFSILFPAVKAQINKNKSTVEEALPNGSERILMIDDEPVILKVIGDLLSKYGYQVTAENDSLLALEHFKERPDNFDLVLSDVTMPKITGDRLAKEMLAIRPDLPIILCTGYTRLVTEQTIEPIGVRALLHKPVVKSKLLMAIRRLLDEPVAVY
ncbi:PAS domain-containing hybrid sensor histidine kinase/response regulator [Desulfosarcina cetonica]|uniref:PAS domain-containing hybrid sensor histidine kinase/response regulator n=1 Tax=Desulfosarcina cetonica TaxID=90730 RepID=UPI0009FA96FB|nr:PAS domain-containing sensor histidine kinase [Desulfosarcina cetonica]